MLTRTVDVGRRLAQLAENYVLQETMFERSACTVQRAIRSSDGTRVLVKIARMQHPARIVDELETEYQMTARLGLVNIVKAIDLCLHKGHLALVVEDTGAEPLAKFLGAKLELGTFLDLAIAILDVVSEVHRKSVLHKDLNPQSIWVQRESGIVKLTNFGFAAQLPSIGQLPCRGNVIDGSLPYLSPEQTGRTNRALDPRSDLYSLGVTFYEMLTGKLPYGAKDALEWIHCHIAMQPVPPAELRPDLPPTVSAIVMKMLTKNVDDRYRSARGVKRDFERCREQLQQVGEIKSFALAENDVSEQLQLPQRLIGRERELGALCTAFRRVAQSGVPELCLVGGHAGLGKSSLVRELEKPVLSEHGLFIAGKFEQYARDIPYSTLVQSFTELVLELLSENSERVSVYKKELLSALGVNARLIVDIIPPLELIIGPQPEVPSLPPSEAHNRFAMVLRDFVDVFAKREHPLVLFLDDLQWADSASLAVIQQLLTQLNERRHLLIVGAYRDNEVNEAHPVRAMIHSLRQGQAQVFDIGLGPLSSEDLDALIGTALQQPRSDICELRQIVQEKTAGNPFFTLQFLANLKEEHLLTFDARAERFVWNAASIRSKQYTDNVLELLLRKLERLEPATLKILEDLACLGTKSDTRTIASVLGGSPDGVHPQLAEALSTGILLRVGDGYEFAHDRVQEAAYSLISPTERARRHLAIGRSLLEFYGQQAFEDKVFEVVGQLNQGASCVKDASEHAMLFRLNVIAAEKAKASIAYESARGYLLRASEQLPNSAFGARYNDAFSVELTLAECEYLLGQFDSASLRFKLLLERATSRLDRAKVYRLQVRLLPLSGRFGEAVQAGLAALAMFGINFPETEEAIAREFRRDLTLLSGNMRGRNALDLVDTAPATDPNARMVIDIFAESTPCCYSARPDLFPCLSLKALNYMLVHGNTPQGCRVYMAWAMVLVNVFRDIEQAAAFSQVSLSLNSKFNDKTIRGLLLYCHAAYVNPWHRHLDTSEPYFRQAFQACLQVGDLVFAGYVALSSIVHALQKGENLTVTSDLIKRSLAFATQSHSDVVAISLSGYLQVVERLQGKLDPANAALAVNCRAKLSEANFGTGLALYLVFEQFSQVIFCEYEAALQSSRQIAKFSNAIAASVAEPAHDFLLAVTLARLYQSASPEEQRQHFIALEELARNLERFAADCPENFKAQQSLVAAEIARIEGRDADAQRGYDQAIAAAAKARFLYVEALANELASAFYRERGLSRFAQVFVEQAAAAYARFGAYGKVKQLESEHSILREHLSEKEHERGVLVEQIELLSVVKSLHAISSEIVFDRLMERVVHVVLEHAGADKGAVLLMAPEGPSTAAIVRVTDRREHASIHRAGSTIAAEVPMQIVDYVVRTRQKVVLEDRARETRFRSDAYLSSNEPRSVMCLPLLRQAELVGVLYLENRLTPGAFTIEKVQLLELLATQAAISLDIARLYDELKNENEERRRAEVRAATIFHASPAPMAVVRLSDLKMVDINESNLKSLGFSREQVIGKTPAELGIMSQELLERTARILEDGPVHAQETRVPTNYGTENRMLVSIQKIELAGEPCALSAALDITERTQMEEQLRQAQKMEAIGRLAGGVAHDFNNLLTAINGYSLMVLDNLEPANAMYEPVRQILSAGERAAGLTRQLLAYSRKQVMDVKTWDLNAIVRDIDGMLRRIIGEDVELVAKLSRDIGAVRVDRSQLEQVLLNLVVNARDAMPRGGTLSIETSRMNVEGSDPDSVLDVAPGPYVALSVSDTGVGIPKEIRSKLFDPFFTTKEAGKGTGLGLSTVYGIVKQSGGSISFDSRIGQGTTFRVLFPEVSSAVEEQLDELAPIARHAYRGSETVLLVEDEERVRRYAQGALEAKGYQVLQACNGREALDVLQHGAHAIRLVLSDMIMPDMGGRELADQIKARYPALPIIFMSGYGDPAEIVSSSIGSCLHKPFGPSELAKKVRDALDAASHVAAPRA